MKISTFTQIMFQDCASPSSSLISSFHDHVMVVVMFIMVMIMICMVSMVSNPSYVKLGAYNETLETIWTLVPMVVLFFTAIPSLSVLYLIDEVKSPLINLKIIGNQWFWSYEYDDLSNLQFNSYMILPEDKGSFRLLDTDNWVILPYGVEVRGVVSSCDVIHAWTIPSLGVKVDAVPGRLNQLSFSSMKLGQFFGQCSEICGSLHSFMPICLEVCNLEKFIKWAKMSS